MEYAIEITDLFKKYDATFALGTLDLKIPSGMIVGLIGENGAGKTTLIKALLNIIDYEGNIKIFGKDAKKYEKEIKEDIGVVLDDMFFPEVLTPRNIHQIMKDIFQNWDYQLYLNYLKQFEIPLEKQIKHLSKGMRKKLEIVAALSHHPKLLILDEPTSGLDPVVRNEILDIFLEFIQDEHHTVLLSTHITSDLEHIADHIIFIDHGQKRMDKTRDEIIDYYGILKCGIDSFSKIEQEDIVAYKKNKYDYQILVKDIDNMRRKYSNFVIDKITFDDLMLLMIKGVK